MLETTRGRGAMRVGTIGVGTLDEAARRCGGYQSVPLMWWTVRRQMAQRVPVAGQRH